MNKGQYLEKQIDKVIEYVKSLGGWGQKNHPHRTDDGVYLEGEPFDYYLMTKDKRMAFDAKECHSERWQLKPKDIKQANNLKRLKNCGFEAFFLVYFVHEKKVIRFDVDSVLHVLEQNRKHLKSFEGVDYRFEDVI